MDQTTQNTPRHWVGTEELNPSYWQDEKVREKRAQEFHDKPIETLAAIEKSEGFELARRDFLTLMGASMAMSTVACVRRPVHKIIPYVVKPEEITPGVANFYASTDPETGSGVVVRVREGRPIKLEGNDLHPMTRGALSARGQAQILGLYDPERLTAPATRKRGGSARKAAWQELDAAAIEQLKKVAASGGKVAVLTGEIRSETTRKLVAEFLSQFRQGVHVEYEPLALDEVVAGQELSYGTAVLPAYRFDQADYVLSLGADFLGTWPGAAEASTLWVGKRKLNGPVAQNKTLSKLVTFEGMMSLTGANSDERYPVRPGDELKVALSIAQVISSNGAQIGADAQSLVAGYRPDVVAKDLGMTDGGEAIRKIGLELLKHRGRSIVIAGGISSKTADAVGLQVAVNLINSALGNEGQTVDGASVLPARGVGFAALHALVQDMRDGKVGALVIWGANPAFTLPTSADFVESSKKVGTVIALAERDDESAQLADLVAADHHWLENWGDAHPRKGLYSLQQPVLAPIHDTRSGQDTLLVWTRALGGKGAESWHEYLRASWRDGVAREFGVAAGGFEKFWEGALRDGVVDSLKGRLPASSARSIRSSAVSRLPKFKATSSDATLLALYSKVSMGDGRHANNAWLQEMPDPITTVAWDNYLNVGPAAAEKLGLRQDDVVEVTAEGVRIELPVNIQPGLHPQTVAMAVGYGRKNAGKVGNGKGVDAYPMVKVVSGALVFSGQEVKVRRTGRFFKLAQTQWHHKSENRPVINDLTLAEYIANPGASNHTDPHLRLKEVPSIWPVHDYSKGYQWGMSIDLNSCTGCGACIIACQAENNIPVVGRDNVRISREMHWIRLDRYYSGSPEQPSVVFQPMICQHCENAPCETVCPVLATVHSEDGINQQIYNRCVGTRYCANNCPYKTRRFNFFDHWKSYEGTLNMAWNPEVTVRSRGIMEKCTFCTQRIRDARDKAALEGRHIRDGELKTACQQTCPTEAISFGNINDEYSKVAKLRKHPRDFRALEVLNTKPRVSYLTKVRNTVAAAAHVDGHGADNHGGGH
jgi:Fe-S-cluster-containing dehydrogenase component/anaerobic selenocysteine-containing dehydrogenase